MYMAVRDRFCSGKSYLEITTHVEYASVTKNAITKEIISRNE
jgi:hypothetical protein